MKRVCQQIVTRRCVHGRGLYRATEYDSVPSNLSGGALWSVGAVSSHIDVQATAELLEKSDAQIGAVIESQQLRDIPVNGRNWATLMTLAPGAINFGGGGQRDIRFAGRARDDNNYTFDGIDA